jgi:hypothetical protein
MSKMMLIRFGLITADTIYSSLSDLKIWIFIWFGHNLPRLSEENFRRSIVQTFSMQIHLRLGTLKDNLCFPVSLLPCCHVALLPCCHVANVKMRRYLSVNSLTPSSNNVNCVATKTLILLLIYVKWSTWSILSICFKIWLLDFMWIKMSETSMRCQWDDDICHFQNSAMWRLRSAIRPK